MKNYDKNDFLKKKMVQIRERQMVKQIVQERERSFVKEIILEIIQEIV